MLDPQLHELQQIKRILQGILVCLVLIVFAAAPGWIDVGLIALAIYAILMVVRAISRTARLTISQIWWEATSIWR